MLLKSSSRSCVKLCITLPRFRRTGPGAGVAGAEAAGRSAVLMAAAASRGSGRARFGAAGCCQCAAVGCCWLGGPGGKCMLGTCTTCKTRAGPSAQGAQRNCNSRCACVPAERAVAQTPLQSARLHAKPPEDKPACLSQVHDRVGRTGGCDQVIRAQLGGKLVVAWACYLQLSSEDLQRMYAVTGSSSGVK